MNNLFLLLALTFSTSVFSQSIGLKTGTIFYKPFDQQKVKANPLIGIIFKYSPKRLGIGTEPSISAKKIQSDIIFTDNAGNKITKKDESNKTVLEVPIYVFFKAVDKDFKLNVEMGTSFYGNTQSMIGGLYTGYKINKFLLGFNYRINGPITNQFSKSYHSAFVSVQYNF